MESELGTDPGLLWPLLLVQIVYDNVATKKTEPDFNSIAKIYQKHPLLPQEAPVPTNGTQAKQLYGELLKEYKVDPNLDPITKAAVLAEPLYGKFHTNLVSKMKDDVTDFESAYRQLEEERNLPNDERLKE